MCSEAVFVLSAASLPASAASSNAPCPPRLCFFCYSGQAKPQLSHMPCLLDVLEVTRHCCGTQTGADVRRLAAELSSGLSAQHNGEGPTTQPPPSSPLFSPSNRAQLSLLSAIADNSVGLLTP
ncbi:hypothetical protein Q8A73_001931 [Channa argus]|nr:hypothetical protein Q8A73_001931 [Channa argus]